MHSSTKKGDLECDRTRHIFAKFFFKHDIQPSGDIIVLQIRSSYNLEDLFTKASPTLTFEKLIHNIGTCRLIDLKRGPIGSDNTQYFFFPWPRL